MKTAEEWQEFELANPAISPTAIKRDIQREAMLHALNHVLRLVNGWRILNRPAAYVAAVDDMEIFLMAAIERVENNEPVGSTAIVQ